MIHAMSLIASPFVDVTGTPCLGDHNIVIERDLSYLSTLPDATTCAVAFTDPIISEDVRQAFNEMATAVTLRTSHRHPLLKFKNASDLLIALRLQTDPDDVPIPEKAHSYLYKLAATYTRIAKLTDPNSIYVLRLNLELLPLYAPHHDSGTCIYVQNIFGDRGTVIYRGQHDTAQRDLRSRCLDSDIYYMPRPSALLFNHAGPNRFAHSIPWIDSKNKSQRIPRCSIVLEISP